MDALCQAPFSTLNDWLTDHQAIHPATPRDTAAAFLFGTLCWNLCELVATRWLATGKPPALAQDALRFAIGWEHWVEDGEEGDHAFFTFDNPWRTGANSHGDAAVQALADALAGYLRPLVATLSGAADIAPSALWRLLGDSIGGAFVEAGRSASKTARALDCAHQLLTACPPPVRNKQMRLFELELSPERTGQEEPYRQWFRKRGGCCRYYKVEGGEFCTTCVLRDDQSRNNRLLDYMERQCRTSQEASSA